MLLVDALPLGVPAVPLRVYFASTIATVEAAEGRPIDLVDYGKGPAHLAARVAQGTYPAPAGVVCVAADSSDPIARALLPILAGRGWLVVRGVR